MEGWTTLIQPKSLSFHSLTLLSSFKPWCNNREYNFHVMRLCTEDKAALDYVDAKLFQSIKLKKIPHKVVTTTSGAISIVERI